MSNARYVLSSNHLYLRDFDEQPSPSEIEAWARAGDLFAILGLEIDDINLALAESPSTDVSPRLEILATTLLYLQKHYSASRKN
jgi:hypothetical protein